MCLLFVYLNMVENLIVISSPVTFIFVNVLGIYPRGDSSRTSIFEPPLYGGGMKPHSVSE